MSPSDIGVAPTDDHEHLNGGGIIGAGEHAAVRDAAKAFLKTAEVELGQFSPVTETSLPGVGRVRFYVRTFSGTVGAEGDEQDLGRGRHALSRVFHAGHAVITAVRETVEAR